MNRDIIERIKDTSLIEDVIGETVKLRRAGSNLQGLCPFHNEKSPSFSVSPSRQSFKCFGCGKGGDAITFIQERDGLTFTEAASTLAERYNIEVPMASPQEQQLFERKTQVQAVLKSIQQQFETQKDKAFAYWQSRGFSELTLAEFGVGFADETMTDTLQVPKDLKRAAGLTTESGKAFFRNRFTIPITDSTGNIISFAGRAAADGDSPKYLNTGNTELYDKSKTLFNIAAARRYIRERGEVLITEGYADTMMMWQLGYRNIVAVCGTALTDNHIAEIKRINGGDKNFLRITLLFNGDNAGEKATSRSIPLLLKAGFSVKVAILPPNKDICDVYTEGGDERVREVLTMPEFLKDAVLYAIQKEWTSFNPLNPVEAEEAKKRVAKIIAHVASDQARERYIRTFCASLQEDPRSMRGMVADLTGENVPKSDAQLKKEIMRDSDAPKVPDFPVHVLPEKLQVIIDECAKWLSYPADFTASSILAAAAIAIGRKVRVQYIWDEGTVMYMLLVAPPGSNKSHPLKFAMKPIMLKDKEADKIYQNKRQLMLEGMLDSNDRVECKQVLYSDFTMEALGDGLKDNPDGIGVYIDEGAGWIKNFDRYNKGSEQEFWLQNWSGGNMVVNRKGRKNYVEASNIPVIGTIQNGLLDEISKGGRGLNGFVERIMFVIPENVSIIPLKRRKDRNSDAFSSIFARYAPVMTTILEKIYMASGEDNTKDPQILIFEEDAEDKLTDWANEKRKHLDGIDNEYVRNIYSKIQSVAIRMCLILEVLQWSCKYKDEWDAFEPTKLNIKVETVLKGIELAEYFLKNALKANSIINFSSPIDKLPKNYRVWYRELPEEFTTSDAERVALKMDISRETMFRMLKNQDGDKPLFKKIGHGKYEKTFY